MQQYPYHSYAFNGSVILTQTKTHKISPAQAGGGIKQFYLQWRLDAPFLSICSILHRAIGQPKSKNTMALTDCTVSDSSVNSSDIFNMCTTDH